MRRCALYTCTTVHADAVEKSGTTEMKPRDKTPSFANKLILMDDQFNVLLLISRDLQVVDVVIVQSCPPSFI
jgi:hypothetical protein